MITKETRDENQTSPFPSRAVSMDFPRLRIMPRDYVLPHEKMDTARQIRLIDRLSRDGVLRNPPIVADLGRSGRYLLLDGANRMSALSFLETPHVVVQVEDYDDADLVLSHWNHVVRDLEAKTLIDMVQDIRGVELVESQSTDAPGQHGCLHLCRVVLGERQVFDVFGGRNLFDRIHLLQKITELYYHGEARIDRVNHEELDVIRSHHSNFGALICFRDLTKEEVRRVAHNARYLPSGLTRFLLPRRVLGINFSVELLRSELPLEEKQRRLDEEIQKKVNEKQIRFYGEPTFVFDD